MTWLMGAPVGTSPLPVDISALTGGAMSVRIIALLTVLSVAPALILTMTCFARFLIVFSFLRQALGVQGAPPVQILTGLSLFMTLMVMAPVGQQIFNDGLMPYLDGKLNEKQAYDKVLPPLHHFMVQSLKGRDEELKLFYEISKKTPPASVKDVDMSILIPAFITSELTAAFKMGFYILIPFLVIDILVSAILMSLGMAMLSPVLVSMPIKVLVFVFIDGWGLVIGSLARSSMI